MSEPEATHSYEVLGRLAEGGTTEIFLARGRGAGKAERFFALKRLKRAVTSHAERIREFLDEAQRASQLQHPNVAQVFEVGKLGGSYFFSMEFVNGETLQSLVMHARTRKIQIPVRAVLTIGAAMAAGLHHAHERRGTDGQPLAIVHGDLSPTNTLVSQEGIVKLIDFGSAKSGELGRGKVTPYSSPEQCKGEPLDRRSDLFALGIVLWELLTLDPLYQRASDDDIKHAIETEEPAKPSAKRYDVPPELDAMVLKLLAKNPAERFQDADELLANIEALAQKLTILLSTADLSRMMRLWFGTKSEPTVDPSAVDAPFVLVESEQIPADLARTPHSPIDDQLETLRSAAALITARATARSGNTTGNPDRRPTVPPELIENPGDSFEQIRDRILARARQKKETKQNQIAGAAASPATEQNHLTSGAVAAAPAYAAATNGAPVAAVGLVQRSSEASDRHTRTTAQAPLSVLEEAARRAGIADPIEPTANGVNGHAVASVASAAESAAPAAAVRRGPDEPDKVVVDAEIPTTRRPTTDGEGSRSASGELGNKGTSGVISRSEPKVAIADEVSAPREAPPVKRNVASPTGRHQPITGQHAPIGGGDAAANDDEPIAISRATTESTPFDHRLLNRAARETEKAERAFFEAGEQAGSQRTADRAKERDSEQTGDRDRDAARTRAADDRDAAPVRAVARERDGDPDRTDRVGPPVRHSTAEIYRRPPPRTPWLVPVAAIAGLAAVLVVIMQLRGGGRPHRANAQPPVTAQKGATNKGQPDTLAADRAAADKAAADQAAQDAADKAAADRIVADAAAATDKGSADKAAADKAAADKAAADKAAADKAAADKAAADKAASDKAAAEKINADRIAAEKAAADKAAADKAAADKAAADKAAADKAAADKTVKASGDKAAKSDGAKSDGGAKKEPAEKEPAPTKGIEELFAAGEFAKTNTACTKEVVFTPQKLSMCAEAACQTQNIALAKRWTNAISKSERPAMYEKCRSLGVELEASPPAAPPASPPPAP